MINYVSTKGGIEPVAFDEAVLQGFAADGGLFVPATIPRITPQQFESWATLDYSELAFEILSLYIDRSVIPSEELRRLVESSYQVFEVPDVVKLVPLGGDPNLSVMELFHGPTLSFKDVAMGFLMNVLDYFLKQRGERLSIILATTGDTGPAAAWASAGKDTIDCWPMYPRGMISEEQERQMTTLKADNVHPVGVENCSDGGDDLDFVVAKLFADQELKKKLNLSSVNSINWCRVMVQSVHYFYGYYRTVDKVGDEIIFSVPSGAFGNSFGGYLARSMGLPVKTFICANNVNQALHTAFSSGVFAKKDLVQTMSSAIDIVVPYNFWRFLYFASGSDSGKLKEWMDAFQRSGKVEFDPQTLDAIRDGYTSVAISDELTRETIREAFFSDDSYLLDPHTAVAVAAAIKLKDSLPGNLKIVCLATAHPAKFPEIIRNCLDSGAELPEQGRHPTLDRARKVFQHVRLCDLDNLEYALIDAMTAVHGQEAPVQDGPE
ncbi:MAG: threonine synthase [Gammaproteobacteria bacterium]|nr:threonine synthase [Gammaproteobacteria bacterium]